GRQTTLIAALQHVERTWLQRRSPTHPATKLPRLSAFSKLEAENLDVRFSSAQTSLWPHCEGRQEPGTFLGDVLSHDLVLRQQPPPQIPRRSFVAVDLHVQRAAFQGGNMSRLELDLTRQLSTDLGRHSEFEKGTAWNAGS